MIFHPESFSTFTVSLGQSAHDLAEQSCQSHIDWLKAEQVYLDTLTIYVVDYYLNCLGYVTDRQNSDSQNVVTQTVLDVADLNLKDYGKLECRRVAPNSETVHVPEETWHDRLGYIVVSLNETLDEAEIMGFFQQVSVVEMPLSQLRSLDELPAYLALRRSSQVATHDSNLVHLSHWVKNIFTQGWHSLEELMESGQIELSLQFRGAHFEPKQEEALRTITRTKVFNIGKPEQSILTSLTVNLKDPNASATNIQIEILPTGGYLFLPAELQLSILDEQGSVVMETRTRETNDGIHLEFTADVNDRFDMKISLNDVEIIEDFLV
jgi:hypothetical protein